MKITRIKTSLLTCLVAGNSLSAVEPLNPVQPGPAPQTAIPEVAHKAPLVQKKAWLGVMTVPVDELLSSHLGLENGVVLQVVSDKSPAAEAGLQVNDIITEMNGRVVKDHLSLRKMIHEKAIGDELVFDVISKGKAKKIKTVLTARPMHIGRIRNLPQEREADLGFKLEENLNKALPMIEGFDERVIKVHVEKLRKQFEQMEGKEDILKQLFEEFPELENPNLNNADKAQHPDGKVRLNLKDLVERVIPEGHGQAAFGMNSTIRVKGAEGVVEMKMKNGNKEISIKDLDGEILYQGPFDNPQDKAAIPADLVPRLNELKGVNVEHGKGFKFRFEGLKPAKDALDAE